MKEAATMDLVAFVVNAAIATGGALLLAETPFRSLGVILLTFNGLCAILCALMAVRNTVKPK